MRFTKGLFAAMLLVACCLLPAPAPATDVDGGGDCNKTPTDYGDAPEGVLAYPGTIGKFPTCTSAGPIGTQELACPAISTAPGPAGYVKHVHFAADLQYWLGCFPLTGGGIDTEPDGKVNDTGAAFSACATGLPIDCVETAFGMSFGQDECYGSSDAGIAAAVSFTPCATSTVSFKVWNCATFDRQVYVNVLVDWNQDGDWNDNFQCVGSCAYEWVTKNVPMLITPGCTTLTPPAFTAGPNPGDGWMRVTISDNPVTDDFPWAGSAAMAGSLRNGETEDYPVTIGHPQTCPDYEDWGDAPEEAMAYPSGVVGKFPTCAFFTAPGTQTSACPPLSTPPGPTGYVRHLSGPADPSKFWLGCGNPSIPHPGVDSEINGKTNSTGGPTSICASGVPIDCVETAFGGMLFGQDECYGDLPGDAGVLAPIKFTPCASSTVPFYATNCKAQPVEVFLNILVDWNEDGDWNDNFLCSGPAAACAYEWAVKNVLITLPPGCTPQVSPAFIAGPTGGYGWMRITLTPAPVTDDFPWKGSAAGAGGGQDYYNGGETEDYPVTIAQPCNQGYRDFGDAPEEFPAYASGIIGHFPTCVMPSPPGDQEIECGTPRSTAPGSTGYVMHVALASDPFHFSLGCAVDGESDGKTNSGGPAGTPSFCSPAVAVDCADGFGGTVFGQDECYGDADAGLATPITAKMCTLLTVPYLANLCETQQVQVYLNILADWNRDGDWNDNVACKNDACAYEWPVKNVPVFLVPGCNTYSAPPFLTGPFVGPVWMRMSLSAQPAPDDFPWNGTVSIGGFNGGETEDYVIMVTPENVGVHIDDARGLWFGPVVPNPARDLAMLDYALPRDADVSLAVFDLAGRKVVDLERGRVSAGPHRTTWNFRDDAGRDVPVGHYILKLRAGDTVLTRRVIRVK